MLTLQWLMQSQGQSELDRKTFVFNGSSEHVELGWVDLTRRVCSADTGGFALSSPTKKLPQRSLSTNIAAVCHFILLPTSAVDFEFVRAGASVFHWSIGVYVMAYSR